MEVKIGFNPYHYFCKTVEDFHVYNGLSKEGLDPRHLPSDVLSTDEFLKVWPMGKKKAYKVGEIAKEFLFHVKDMYRRVYQEDPKTGEVRQCFATGLAVHLLGKHIINWAAFAQKSVAISDENRRAKGKHSKYEVWMQEKDKFERKGMSEKVKVEKMENKTDLCINGSSTSNVVSTVNHAVTGATTSSKYQSLICQYIEPWLGKVEKEVSDTQFSMDNLKKKLAEMHDCYNAMVTIEKHCVQEVKEACEVFDKMKQEKARLEEQKSKTGLTSELKEKLKKINTDLPLRHAILEDRRSRVPTRLHEKLMECETLKLDVEVKGMELEIMNRCMHVLKKANQFALEGKLLVLYPFPILTSIEDATCSKPIFHCGLCGEIFYNHIMNCMPTSCGHWYHPFCLAITLLQQKQCFFCLKDLPADWMMSFGFVSPNSIETNVFWSNGEAGLSSIEGTEACDGKLMNIGGSSSNNIFPESREKDHGVQATNDDDISQIIKLCNEEQGSVTDDTSDEDAEEDGKPIVAYAEKRRWMLTK